jgi:hypothetical protein
MKSIFWEKLRQEPVSELRRAAEDLIAQGVNECLADLYANAEPYVPDEATRLQFCQETLYWFKQIPCEIKWVDKGQPFVTMGQMARFVKREGYLPMFAAASVLHASYHRHRAVHDYFGHIVPNIPFGIVGELAAYRIHEQMYSKNLWDLIFSDVVLNNVYYEVNGQFFASEKYVKLDGSCISSH